MKSNQIKAALAEKGIRHRAIALACGVSDSTVYKVIWSPDIVVSTKVAMAIAAAIGKPIEKVFPCYAKREAA